MILLSEGAGATSGVFDVMKEFVEFAIYVFGQMLSQPVLLLLIAAGLVGVGISVVRKLRGAAK